ncbi:Chitin synthase 4 [Smittium culicis]|uniref:Chitin synthase 4 n=1 Tax=Smittium culicis TaxID=133412 RepID=A0A1R1Y161_9FUNG|nr:Chitin synthase 4 [Smittium culicis]
MYKKNPRNIHKHSSNFTPNSGNDTQNQLNSNTLHLRNNIDDSAPETNNTSHLFDIRSPLFEAPTDYKTPNIKDLTNSFLNDQEILFFSSINSKHAPLQKNSKKSNTILNSNSLFTDHSNVALFSNPLTNSGSYRKNKSSKPDIHSYSNILSRKPSKNNFVTKKIKYFNSFDPLSKKSANRMPDTAYHFPPKIPKNVPAINSTVKSKKTNDFSLNILLSKENQNRFSPFDSTALSNLSFNSNRFQSTHHTPSSKNAKLLNKRFSFIQSISYKHQTPKIKYTRQRRNRVSELSDIEEIEEMYLHPTIPPNDSYHRLKNEFQNNKNNTHSFLHISSIKFKRPYSSDDESTTQTKKHKNNNHLQLYSITKKQIHIEISKKIFPLPQKNIRILSHLKKYFFFHARKKVKFKILYSRSLIYTGKIYIKALLNFKQSQTHGSKPNNSQKHPKLYFNCSKSCYKRAISPRIKAESIIDNRLIDSSNVPRSNPSTPISKKKFKLVSFKKAPEVLYHSDNHNSNSPPSSIAADYPPYTPQNRSKVHSLRYSKFIYFDHIKDFFNSMNFLSILGTKIDSNNSTMNFIAYSLLIVIVVTILILIIFLISSTSCNAIYLYTTASLARSKNFSALGSVFNINQKKSPELYNLLLPYSGYDVSNFFAPYKKFLNPESTPSNNVDFFLNSCSFNLTNTSSWFRKFSMDPDNAYNIDNFNNMQQKNTDYRYVLNSNRVGLLYLPISGSFTDKDFPYHYVIINKELYDFTVYLKYSTYSTIENDQTVMKINHTSSFIDPKIVDIILKNKGLDITNLLKSNITNTSFKSVTACLKKFFYRGVVSRSIKSYACVGVGVFEWFILSPLFFGLLYQNFVYLVILFRQKKHYNHKLQNLSPNVNSSTYNKNIGKKTNSPNLVNLTNDEDTNNLSNSTEISSDSQNKLAINSHNFKLAENDGNNNSSLQENHYIENFSTNRRQISNGTFSGSTMPLGDDTLSIAENGTQMISSTINSILDNSYSTENLVLFIVVDGSNEVLKNVIEILDYCGSVPEPKIYGSQGQDLKSQVEYQNRDQIFDTIEDLESFLLARVFSGTLKKSGISISYVIVAKDSYQGLLDSIMLTFGLFNGIEISAGISLLPKPKPKPTSNSSNLALNGNSLFSTYSPRSFIDFSKSNPFSNRLNKKRKKIAIFLEDELYNTFTELGYPLDQFEYCLVVDVGMYIEKFSIRSMVTKMNRDTDIDILQGSIETSYRGFSIPKIIQTYEALLRYTLNSYFGGLIGAKNLRDRGFTLYRVLINGEKQFIGSPEIQSQLGELVKNTVHNRQMLSGNGDSVMDLLLIKTFPGTEWRFDYMASSKCRVYESLHELDINERQWLKTRIHLILEHLKQRRSAPLSILLLDHLQQHRIYHIHKQNHTFVVRVYFYRLANPSFCLR